MQKLALSTALVGGLLSIPGQAQAGRHSQSTHYTPKGYHHDGTFAFEARPAEFVLCLLVLGLGLVAVVAAATSTGQPSPRPSYNEPPSIDDRAIRPQQVRRNDRRERRRQARRDMRDRQREFWTGIRGRPVNIYRALPEWGRPILWGLGLALPIVGIFGLLVYLQG